MRYLFSLKSHFITVVTILLVFTTWPQSIQAEPHSSTFNVFKNAFSKPFKRSISTTSSSITSAQQPALLWNRLREKFSLPNHESDPRVQFYIKRYTESQIHFNEMVNNARPYLHYIAETVETHDMPAEIALLPMVESTFDPTAKSSSGARGLWQIMPETGLDYGLSRDAWFDGCQDIALSTNAALRHLKYLHQRYSGDWLLALAAYNSGEGRVTRAINKNKKINKATDFWELNLPKQTADYVPKLMAIVTIIKTPDKYGVVLPNILNQPYFTQIDIGKAVDIKQAALMANMPEKKLANLNPGFYTQRMNPNGPYELCVPVHVAENFNHLLTEVPAIPSAQATKHKVQPGDSLSKIAQQYKTTTQTLKSLNQLSSDTIQVGKYLLLPQKEMIASTNKDAKTHTVKKGESLSTISEQYKVSIKKLMAQNNITSPDIIQPGQKIVIKSA